MEGRKRDERSSLFYFQENRLCPIPEEWFPALHILKREYGLETATSQTVTIKNRIRIPWDFTPGILDAGAQPNSSSLSKHWGAQSCRNTGMSKWGTGTLGNTGHPFFHNIFLGRNTGHPFFAGETLDTHFFTFRALPVRHLKVPCRNTGETLDTHFFITFSWHCPCPPR